MKTAAKRPVAESSEPSGDDIRLRAYFIAEDRHRTGVSGNPDSDWIEALRQLREESSKR